ncbi:hypothetical protein BLJAPNOD_02339 [Ensifer sp. M14]|uniref:hypothetical protein n=1 Tax=Ensifer sp. M14 TaxID=2203782 RepID=UPI000E1DD749|nr:hypothetical protein [Ensifer sp. M14]RDL51207.1 hypothetical protein BLJAPNOD_02339 [Ensifer sp. M14]
MTVTSTRQNQPAAPLTQSREIILAVTTLGRGHFIEESDCFGTTFATAAEWLEAHDGEHATRLIRFDLDALHGEDISEAIADAWLDDFDRTPDDEHLLPAFVRTSHAWERWCADFKPPTGDPGQTVPFRQRGHGTLNHRQQFGA